MNEWFPFLGSIVTVILAGLFALYQSRRSATAERALEEQKLIMARRENEIAQERQLHRQFQQEQILPFLEQLDRAVTQSYSVVQIPHYYIDLAGYVPLLRMHADTVMTNWLKALEEMSNRRIRMLLSIDSSQANTIASLMAEFVTLSNKILEDRFLVFYKNKSLDDLIKTHRDYISKGYRLMTEIQNAALNVGVDTKPLSTQEVSAFAEGLALSVEKGSVVTVPFGAKRGIGWIAIWEIDITPAWQEFEQNISGTSFSDFETALQDFAKELYSHDHVVEVTLQRVNSTETKLYCIPIKFVGVEQQNGFLNAGLPAFRKKYPALWSSFRSPYEITVG